MDHDFWLQRWREGRIGFNNERVLPLLQKHWPALDLPRSSRVFVPLAGKSLDMLWLAAQGHRVLGVELSELAVAQFFAQNGLEADIHKSRYGVHHLAGNIELIRGDAFVLDAAALADCAAVYDRAADRLVAQAARALRRLYANLPRGCEGLLLTLEYPQHEKAGPPFSVGEAEVRERFAPAWRVDLRERRAILDAEPRFAADGVTVLATAVYHLRKAS